MPELIARYTDITGQPRLMPEFGYALTYVSQIAQNEHEILNDSVAPGRAVESGTGARPHPGDIVIDRDLGVAPEPLVGSDASTALEEDEEETSIPSGPLWVMKARRHTQWHLLPSSERHERLRETLGPDGAELYAIDDGRHHVMIARLVGSTGGDVEYVLGARLSRADFAALQG